ncbi:hypothetical protein [Spiroplasma endosymbiont of Crioceris asparagi]|uniref:hypothetical protein n=1 Tax=Spiroplasma endosymbiont of Crioceris asparagi TaxID=3066286 RepID=UPI0030D2E9FA
MKKLVLVFVWIILSLCIGIYLIYYLPEISNKTAVNFYNNKKSFIDIYNWAGKELININFNIKKAALLFTITSFVAYGLFTANIIMFIRGFKKANMFRMVSCLAIFILAFVALFHGFTANVLVAASTLLANFFLGLFSEWHYREKKLNFKTAETGLLVEEMTPLDEVTPMVAAETSLNDQFLAEDINNSLKEIENINNNDLFEEQQPYNPQQILDNASAIASAQPEIVEDDDDEEDEVPAPMTQAELNAIHIHKHINSDSDRIWTAIKQQESEIQNLAEYIKTNKNNNVESKQQPSIINVVEKPIASSLIPGRIDRNKQSKEEYDRIKLIMSNN